LPTVACPLRDQKDDVSASLPLANQDDSIEEEGSAGGEPEISISAIGGLADSSGAPVELGRGFPGSEA
jgi:hypothetical protein